MLNAYLFNNLNGIHTLNMTNNQTITDAAFDALKGIHCLHINVNLSKDEELYVRECFPNMTLHNVYKLIDDTIYPLRKVNTKNLGLVIDLLHINIGDKYILKKQSLQDLWREKHYDLEYKFE